MTNMTNIKVYEKALQVLIYACVWGTAFAGFVWFVDQTIAEMMFVLPWGTLLMVVLGLINDTYGQGYEFEISFDK